MQGKEGSAGLNLLSRFSMNLDTRTCLDRLTLPGATGT
jgi:hypothetical protein